MEGVVVSAKRPGSTIMVSVSTNAQGQYSFPRDRLAPGTYDITMRAVGYALMPMVATIQSDGSTQLDLKLAKDAPNVLALQMSNAEWMQSAPGALHVQPPRRTSPPGTDSSARWGRPRPSELASAPGGTRTRTARAVR